MRILVTGGRNYTRIEVVNLALDAVHRKRGISVLIEGGARGADRLAQLWGHANRVHVITEYANWRKYGPAAGVLRNAAMLLKHRPDAVVAFPGGSGTADMVARAEAAGVPVWRVKDS